VGGHGHRILPHTADLRLEAWGPTRESCLAEAVRGLAEAFVDPASATPTAAVPVAVDAAPGTDLLVALLEEVIFAVDVLGVVPLRAHLAVGTDGRSVTGTFDVAPLADLARTGSAPKAITRHRLRFGPGDGGWRCLVTVDV
jgi:SHS2 domain-containing protein